MDKIIAITGGIGSGKSTVSKIIKELGYKVFSADEVYCELLQDENFVKNIYKSLDIKTDKLVYDRNLVSSKVFNNKEMLEKLNAATHPNIMYNMLKQSKNESGIVFNEVPLLFEGGYEKLYDNVIIVSRNLDSRIEAVSKRDNLPKEKVIERINNQINYEKIDCNAHTLIINDKGLDELLVKVKAVVDKIVKD